MKNSIIMLVSSLAMAVAFSGCGGGGGGSSAAPITQAPTTSVPTTQTPTVNDDSEKVELPNTSAFSGFGSIPQLPVQ